MYKTHGNFTEWASQYDSRRRVGRNMLSQNNFVEILKRVGGETLRFEENLPLEDIVNKSLFCSSGDLLNY